MNNEEKLRQLDEIIESGGECPSVNSWPIYCCYCVLKLYDCDCDGKKGSLMDAVRIKKKIERESSMEETKELKAGDYVIYHKEKDGYGYIKDIDILLDGKPHMILSILQDDEKDNSVRVEIEGVEEPYWYKKKAFEKVDVPEEEGEKKVYHTPCGDFEEGEMVKTAYGNRIFISYAQTLNMPYICVITNNEENYKNNLPVTLSTFNPISKLPEKQYKAYDKPSLDWIGKEVIRKCSQTSYTIVGFECIGKSNKGILILLKNTDELNESISSDDAPKLSYYLYGLFKNYTWADGSVFGQEV